MTHAMHSAKHIVPILHDDTAVDELLRDSRYIQLISSGKGPPPVLFVLPMLVYKYFHVIVVIMLRIFLFTVSHR